MPCQISTCSLVRHLTRNSLVRSILAPQAWSLSLGGTFGVSANRLSSRPLIACLDLQMQADPRTKIRLCHGQIC